jgi:hypothetical protein
MEKQNFRIRLELTEYGTSPFNPNSVDTRIGEAIGAAGRHRVRGRNDTDLSRHDHRNPQDTGIGADRTVIWHVHGELDDVMAMIDRWRGNADSADPNTYPAFTPNVTVSLETEP